MKHQSTFHRETAGQIITRRALGFITALSLVLGALSWTSFTWSKNELFHYRDLSAVEEELPLVKLEEPKLTKPPKPKNFVVFSPDPEPEPEPTPEPEPDPNPGIEPDPFGNGSGIDDSYRDVAGDDDTPWVVVEHMPCVPGCEHLKGDERNRCTEAAIVGFLSEHVRFPRKLMDSYDSGSVYLSFVIGKDGRVKDLKILRETHRLFGEEVLNAASNLPRFTPGEQHGRKVSVQYVIPVKFRKS